MRKISEILDLCIKISKTTVADVFFNYSPHVPQIDLRIHYNGWISSDEVIDKFKESKTIMKFSEWEDRFRKVDCITVMLDKDYSEASLYKLIVKLEQFLKKEENDAVIL